MNESDQDRPAEWFDDDSFWIDTYDFIFTESHFEVMEDVVDHLLELLGIEGGDLLDLCCGPGRYAVELARRGFRVTAVDRTRFLLDKARTRAAAAGVEIEWIQSDMRDFVRPGAFDVALSMFTSFGYFDEQEENLRVLRRLHESLRPGGQAIIDVMGKELLARHLEPVTARELEDGAVLVERREIFDDWTRMRARWLLIRDDRVQTFHFHHTVYSGQELRDLLLRAGFTRVRLYGGLTGRAYDRDARRLVAVAVKAG